MPIRKARSTVELSDEIVYDESAMMKDELESFRGQQVEVIYNAMSYRGELAGASEDEIYLKTAVEWVSLSMEGITQIRKAEPPIITES